jgi:uncharacterized membrane protein
MSNVLTRSAAATKEFFTTGIFDDTGFLFHLAAYLFVNFLLVAINLLTTPNELWFYWPLLGWGIGILAHGLAVHFALRRKPQLRF